ncbi:MAG: hypothetical protein PHH13_00640 [Candidatus Peribacteraceae bacterium]|nr:hypothetical protein [Candidatus Peribacteraceae bacterium]
MHATKHSSCTVEGCGKPSLGKAYCNMHMKEVRKGKKPHAVAPLVLGPLVHSNCCNAQCFNGKRHEYGEQYCKKCGEACCWKNV